jgi:hypothetical protein
MNARELAISIKRSLNDDNGMFGPCHKIEFHRAHWETILSALALLAAAEANDGSTPRVDKFWAPLRTESEWVYFARTLERERNGLAAEVGRLKEQLAEREETLAAIFEPENQPSQFGLVTLEYHNAEIAKLRPNVSSDPYGY